MRRQVVVRGLGVATAALFAAAACGGSSKPGGASAAGNSASGASGSTTAGTITDGGNEGFPGGAPNEAGSASGGRAGNAVGGERACVGLECAVPTCDVGSTRLVGKVFDPAGLLPLYNVSVFVPNEALPALEAGPSCRRCGDPGVATITSTTTDATGSFVLENAPAGAQIPLVIQIGKWRRQVVVSNVVACGDREVEPELTRLPRNKKEGDLPHIALVAGAADKLECLPRRLGIDDAEITAVSGDGSVHLFVGHYNEGNANADWPITKLQSGATLTTADELWSTTSALSKYDMVLLACEGNTFQSRKPLASRQALYEYLSLGGRVLASHWQHLWFSNGHADLTQLGTWTDRDDPTDSGAGIETHVNESFPKGAALAEWLVQTAASTSRGSLNVYFARDNIQAVSPTLGREWLTLESPQYPQTPKSVQLMSFTAPVGAPPAQACGRGAYTSIHADDQSASGEPGERPAFPLGCEDRILSGQEKALAFMLFELDSCLGPDDVP